MIWSSPVPPLTVSRTVKLSVAKNVKVSSPEPPNRDKLPAAFAETLRAVVSESPVAVEALIVELAPGLITIPGLAAKKASLTVSVVPVVKFNVSILEMLTNSDVVNVAAALKVSESVPAPPSTVSVPKVVKKSASVSAVIASLPAPAEILSSPA